MKIRNKILIGCALLIGIVLVQGTLDYQLSLSAEREMRQLRQSSLPEILSANVLFEALGGLETTLALPPATQTRAAISHRLDTFAEALARARDLSAATPQSGTTPVDHESADRETVDVDVLQQLNAAFSPVRLRWQESTNMGGISEVSWRDQVESLRGTLSEQVRPLVVSYRDNSLHELAELSLALEARSQAISRYHLGVVALAVGLAGAASFWLFRTFMRPLDKAIVAVEALNSGDLLRRFDTSDRDEFSTLARAFNQLLDQQKADSVAHTDISEIADARANELNKFIELSMDVLAVASPAGYFTRVNSAFANALGRSVEEILARPWLEFVHPDDHAKTLAADNLLSNGESVCNFENRYHCADGSWKWFSWQVRPDATSGQYFAVAREVTDKKAAERALHESRHELRLLNENLEQLVLQRTARLRESENRFRAVVEGVKDYAIITLNPHGMVESWNAGAARIKGYAAEEIIGRSFASFYRPEDIAAGKPARGLKIARTEGRYEETGSRVRKDGTQFFANVLITAVHDENGMLQGYAKITRDITEQHNTAQALRQQQELLRLLMDNLSEGVVACDADGRLTFFNKTAREWHGSDVNDQHAERWAEFFDLYEADGTNLMPLEKIPLVRAFRGERVRNSEMVIGRKGKPPRLVEASGDALTDDEGKRIGAVVVMHDLTDRRQAERHNLRTQRLESIGTLAGGIAHDLNNALAPILMGIELMKMRYPGANLTLETMEASARRGASMVRQLLTFAKGIEGKRVSLDPKHLIKEIENLIESTFPKNIELRVHYDHHGVMVLGDATQLHQVLLNLCVNSRDAMPDGGTLKIMTDRRDIDELYASSLPDMKPGRYLRIRVTDTGTGIPPHVIDRIFEPFFSTKAPEQGTGLGLSTVMGIVRSHGGVIQVYSPPSEASRGTQFSVYLPASPDSHAETMKPFPTQLELMGNDRTILVVDDEVAVREISQSVLESLGFKVIAATTGVEAVQQLIDHQRHIAAIITDLHMPQMNGLLFVEKALEALPGIPIIVSSGRIEKADADRLSELNVRVLLHKPFTQGDLVDALHQAFTKDSLHPFRAKPW